jgi:hypothetical protein
LLVIGWAMIGASAGARTNIAQEAGKDRHLPARGNWMRKSEVSLYLGLALAFISIGTATAQQPTPAQTGASFPAAVARADMKLLKGAWVRPDGGYRIAIKSVGRDGRLEATYFNPNPLPFAKAQASREGETLRAFFELRAGGYDGSTYELTYDPASDRLMGTYYQAVAKQKFDVFFARK